MKNALLLLALVCAMTGAAMAQDAAPAAAPAGAPAAIDQADQDFINKAASAGLLEVELGNLVAGKAQDENVKKFAQQMVGDHSKANDELKALLGQKNIPVPAMLPEHREQLDAMQKLEVAELEKQYKQKMVDNHQKSIETFQKGSSDAKDADIKAFAAKTLPKLQHHLQMAQLMNEGKPIDAHEHGAVPAPAGDMGGGTLGSSIPAGDQTVEADASVTGGSQAVEQPAEVQESGNIQRSESLDESRSMESESIDRSSQKSAEGHK